MKILLFANTDWYLYNFRLSLARTLREGGCEVVLVSPPGIYSGRLQQAGFRWVCFQMERRRINPLREIITVARVFLLYRREHPDLVHHFTIKCVLYGSVAAKLVGIGKIVNAITGLGYIFTDRGWQARSLRAFLNPFYRVALARTNVIFENLEDLKQFSNDGFVRSSATHLIHGAGVDVTEFCPSVRKVSARFKRILLAGRLLWSKGISEFVEAASIVHAVFPGVTFQVAGTTDVGNPDTIEEHIIEAWSRTGHVEFLGHRDDMLSFLREADVVVLPSYREGVPKILTEAAACGCPLVATDTPGCREIVRHGINGLLVPMKNSQALADAIMTLLRDDPLRDRMGKMSRKIACEEFSDKRVIAETLDVYRLAGLPVTTGAKAAERFVGTPRSTP